MDEFLEGLTNDGNFSYADMEAPFGGLDPGASANSLLVPEPASAAPPTPTAQEPALDFLRTDAAPDPTSSAAQSGAATLLFQESPRLVVSTPAIRTTTPTSSIAPVGAPVISTLTTVSELERSMAAHNGPAVVSSAPPRAPPVDVAPPQPQFAPPPDSARRRLRPVADSLVARCWKAAHSPAAFVAVVRSEMNMDDEFDNSPSAPPHVKLESSPTKSSSKSPTRSPPGASKKRAREGDISGAPDPKRIKDGDASRRKKRSFTGWTLDKNAEGALLDALISRLCTGEASSARLMGYLRHALLSGLVSSRAVLATCVTTVAATPSISARALQAISRLICELLPHYHFTSYGDALTTECTNYLQAFAMVLRCAVKAPYFSKELVYLLSMNRVIALVRSCARRVPTGWEPINAAIAALETKAPDNSASPASVQSTPLPLNVSPELESQLLKLKFGLAKGCTSFARIAAVAEKNAIPPETAGLVQGVSFALPVAAHFFGRNVARVLGHIWLKPVQKPGDLAAFLEIENELAQQTAQGQFTPQLSLRDSVRACESIIRFIAERAARPEWTAQWNRVWGGKKRLIGILRDTVPQIRSEIRSELGCIIISMAITGCVAMCLGPSLRLNDPNQRAVDASSAARRVEMDGEIADTMGDFAGYAVGAMEEAAAAEETPPWRSFGLWVLLFASRCGALLSASGCKEVRAAKVLRAWGGIPTGTPGSHAGGAHRGSGQAGSSSSASSTMNAAAEVVAVFATPAAHAIIDVADVSGSDETLHALCCDYIQ